MTTRRISLLLLVVTIAWAMAVASASACGYRVSARATGSRQPGARGGLFVGDSTGIFAVPHLGRAGFAADAKECRQFGDGVALLRARRHADALPHLVVLAVGANGPVGLGAIRRAMAVVGARRVLALVTPRNQTPTQAAMRAAGRRFPSRVLLLDWAVASRGRAGWFAGDGLHVNARGARGYAEFIRHGTRGVVAPPSQSLRFHLDGPAGKPCGKIRRSGRVLRVDLVRGAKRTTCAVARRLARRPPLRVGPRWSWWDWQPVRRARIVDVFLRRDHRTMVITRSGAQREETR